MELLEREGALSALGSWASEAGSGAGRIVLIAGEAGIGKSTLVQTFCRQQAAQARIWWGACDALNTPRPLGPLYDIARAAGGELAAIMASEASRHERFVGFLEALHSPLRPTIVVVEDVHWADEATHDLLVFVARRISRARAMLLVTYRDDEVGPDHPLRGVLGHLAPLPPVERLGLPALTEAAVAELAAGRDADPAELHRLTGGNPFFLTEVLASGDGAIPATISDAVLARASQLPPAARRALDAAAVVPDEVELELLRLLLGPEASAIDTCLEAGLLVPRAHAVRFRHELGRLSVEAAIPTLRRTEFHRAVLTWLRSRPRADPARLAYHADAAGDRDAVLEHAPQAAEQARKLGATREAHGHLAQAMQHAAVLPLPERAELVDRYVVACVTIGRLHAAADASARAIELHEQIGDPTGLVRAKLHRAKALWSLARNDEAHLLASESLGLLEESVPRGAVHVEVLATVATLRMLARDIPAALELGNRALDLADQLEGPVDRTRALGAVGAALWFRDPQRAEQTLREVLDLTRGHGQETVHAVTLVNLGSGAGELRRYASAERWLAEAITWCEARDLDEDAGYARAWSARTAFEQGRWPAAAERLAALSGRSLESEPTRIVALTTDGRLRTRRGDPGADAILDEAWDLAEATGDLQRLWPVAAGRAEAAWLRGDLGAIPRLLAATFDLAIELEHGWAIGELAFWLWRAGRLVEVPTGSAAPFALQIGGDWQGAAAAWEQLGCPYEAAVALADSGQAEALRQALVLLGDLGATPMADRVAAALRDRGIRRLPRRPSRTTVDNPAGLTNRQLEVLTHLVAGRTNNQIAVALHLSPKTVGHHVSAILDRLDVPDRHTAARRARELGVALE